MNKLFVSLIILTSLNSLQAMEERALRVGGATAVGMVGMYGMSELSKRIMDMKNFHAADQTLISAEGQYQKFPNVIENLQQRNTAQKNYNKTKRNYLFNAALCGALKFGSFITAGYLLRYAYSGKLPVNNAQTYGSVLALIAGGALAETSDSQARFDNHERKLNTLLSKYMYVGGGALAAVGLYGLYKNK